MRMLESEVRFVQERAKRVFEEQERRAVALMEEIEARFERARFCRQFFIETLCLLLEKARQAGADWEKFKEEYLPKICGPLEHGQCQCYKTPEGILALLDEYDFVDLFQEYLEF